MVAWHFSHWMISKVNLPYTKFFPIKKRVKVEDSELEFYTEENFVTLFSMYKVPMWETENLYAKKIQHWLF